MNMQGRTKLDLHVLGSWSERFVDDSPCWTHFPRVPFAILVAFAFATVLFPQSPSSAPPDTASIHGVVFDSVEKPVPNTLVSLEREDGAPVAEAVTNASGAFEFRGLQEGTYRAVAHRQNLRSSAVIVIATASHESHIVNLVFRSFEPEATAKRSSATSPTDSMEFADEPKFTVAGVTDWTAAGGHGSDAVLRTSEAVTREALVLDPKSGNAPDASLSKVKDTPRENELLALIKASPENDGANRELGKLYFESGRWSESVPFLERASKRQPEDREIEYDLAQAYMKVGDLKAAKGLVQRLLADQTTADLYRMDGEIDEGLGDPLHAVHAFELSARMDPSERNIFAWGSELLLHRAVWQAKDVFTKGVKDYPKSVRMMTALGAALFAGALYEEAALRLCDASDLDPAAREPYILIGKIEVAAPASLPCVNERLARFVRLMPEDALANYFYGRSIWKRNRASLDAPTKLQIRTLFSKAAELDERCGDALLELGNLDFAQNNFQSAIGFYTKAIGADPKLIEAHYRMGMAYDRMGEKAKASHEFELHDTLKKQQAAIIEQQRRDVKQFQIVAADKSGDPKSR